MSKIPVLLMFLILSGCANPYAKFYIDKTGGMDITKAPSVVLYSGKPKLFTGKDPDEDNQRLMEDGFALLGISSFNGANVNFNKAISHAEEVHAEIVVCYSKYTGTNSGVMPLTLPNNQTSTTTMSGNAYGSGGYANFNGTANTTTYGTQTTYIPYNVHRFDYFASYWIRKKPPIFGVFAQDLNEEQRKEYNGNKGISVLAVIKGSPAYRADLLKGDVIRTIGETDLYDMKDYQTAIEKYQGQKVKVIYLRDGKALEKDIQFNQKPD